MEDLEAQIAQAADELAREGSKTKVAAGPDPAGQAAAPPSRPTARAGKRGQRRRPTNGGPRVLPQPSRRRCSRPATRRPTPTTTARGTIAPSARAINRRSSNAVYWLVAFLSIVWISGGAVLARLIDGPDFWRITSLQQLLNKPELIGIAIAVVIPMMLFWGFAIMVRRAQDMRIAAQSMTEVAFRLAEPEASPRTAS